MGMRLWPPASTLASSPRVASSLTAAAMLSGRWYSTEAGIILPPYGPFWNSSAIPVCAGRHGNLFRSPGSFQEQAAGALTKRSDLHEAPPNAHDLRQACCLILGTLQATVLRRNSPSL